MGILILMAIVGNLWDYSIEVDKSATSDWYEKSEGWGCEFVFRNTTNCKHIVLCNFLRYIKRHGTYL